MEWFGTSGLYYSVKPTADGDLTVSSRGCTTPGYWRADPIMYLLQAIEQPGSTTAARCMAVRGSNSDTARSGCPEITAQVKAGEEYIVFVTSWQATQFYPQPENYFYRDLPLTVTLSGCESSGSSPCPPSPPIPPPSPPLPPGRCHIYTQEWHACQ